MEWSRLVIFRLLVVAVNSAHVSALHFNLSSLSLTKKGRVKAEAGVKLSNPDTPGNPNVPDYFPNGMETVYKIPIMKNMNYSLEKIFQKKLYMLLPFYILHYEKWIKEEGTEKVMDMLESDLRMIYNELNKEVKEDVISDYEVKLFMQLIWNIAEQVFRDSEAMKERTGEIMGGQVLEFEWETEYRKQINEAKDEGRNEGRKEGRREGENRGFVLKLISLICRKLKKNKTPEMITEELDEDLERIEQICRAAEGFAPDYDEEKIYNVLGIAQF